MTGSPLIRPGDGEPPDLSRATRALLAEGLRAREDVAGLREDVLVLGGAPVGFRFRPEALERASLGSRGPASILVVRLAGAPATRADEPRSGDRGALLELCYGLTAREAQIAGMLVDRMRPEEVAARLGLKVATVRSHVKRLFDKVGVNGQAELVSRLLSGPVGWL